MGNLPLLCRIAAGDTTAVDGFIHEYGGLVFSIAKSFYTSHEEIEDAVQDVFIDLWSKASRFQPEIASEKTFVAVLARRRLIDRCRKWNAKRRASRQVEAFDIETVADKRPSIDRLEIQEQLQELHRLLNQLPCEQQKVLRLAVFEQKTHSQIARETQLPLGTVKTLIRQGLLQIKRRSGNRYDDEKKYKLAPAR